MGRKKKKRIKHLYISPDNDLLIKEFGGDVYFGVELTNGKVLIIGMKLNEEEAELHAYYDDKQVTEQEARDALDAFNDILKDSVESMLRRMEEGQADVSDRT